MKSSKESMIRIRISKYDPNRKLDNFYLNSQWNDCSDIGSWFAGRVLSYNEYRTIEEKYVNVAQVFFKEFFEKKIFLAKTEVYESTLKEQQLLTIDQQILFKEIKEGKRNFDVGAVKDLTCILMRNIAWFEIRLLNKPYCLYFGYDLYMHPLCG